MKVASNKNFKILNKYKTSLKEEPDRLTIMRGRKYAFAFALLILFYLCYTVISKREAVIVEHLLLGSLVVILGSLPTFFYLRRGMKDSVPLMPLHGIFYTITFGIVAFSDVNPWLRPGDEYMTKALYATIAGLICLYFGYYKIGYRLFYRLLPFRFPGKVSIKDMSIIGWIFETIYLIWIAFSPDIGVPSIEQLVPVLGWCGKAILFYQILDGSMRLPGRLLFVGFILPYELLIGFTSGALANVFFLLIFIGVIILYVRKRVPLLLAVLPLLILFIFQPVKNEYRGLVWGGYATNYGTLEKAKLFTELAIKYFGGDHSVADASSMFYSRTDHLGTMAAIVSQTPDKIPYIYGSSYLQLLTSWIPRIIWTDKPREDFGNEWAKWYGLLAPSDYTTSYNLPWLPEFYMNFGLAGVAIGMFLIGILFRFLAIKFCSIAASSIEFIIGVTLTFKLFAAESNLSLCLGSVFSIFVALYIIMRLTTTVKIKA